MIISSSHTKAEKPLTGTAGKPINGSPSTERPRTISSTYKWLHPKVGNYIPSMRNDNALKNRAILAIKNSRVDFWNTTMQDMNPNDSVQLKSFDYFTDVDDPNGHLASMLTEHVLNEYTNSQVPNHTLTLKVDDICFIMRPLKASGLASNTRVRIHDIKHKVITVKILDSDNPNHFVFVPRMRFNFCLKYTSAYNMTRVQFPLKLCYGMTVDKSQGQSFEDVLLDFTDESFSHGQTYVGFSRARNYKNVRIIVQDDKVMDLPYRTDTGDITFKKAPLVSCTTYPSVIQKPL
jgi:ATP-dependent DNA helicase PIF1